MIRRNFFTTALALLAAPFLPKLKARPKWKPPVTEADFVAPVKYGISFWLKGKHVIQYYEDGTLVRAREFDEDRKEWKDI